MCESNIGFCYLSCPHKSWPLARIELMSYQRHKHSGMVQYLNVAINDDSIYEK